MPAGGGRPPIDRVEDETPEGPIFSRKEAPREEKRTIGKARLNGTWRLSRRPAAKEHGGAATPLQLPIYRSDVF